MKNVLLLGDSIRLNYMPMVCRTLDGKAKVVGPADNCRFSKYMLFYFNEWLALFDTPDIIHFNAGLWDLSHANRTTGALTSENEYANDLGRIVDEMQRLTQAKIIFATSTPVLPGNPYFHNDDIVRYNEIAVGVMEQKGIEINDLHTFVKPNVGEFIDKNDLTHLNKDGIKAVGGRVAEVVEKYL